MKGMYGEAWVFEDDAMWRECVSEDGFVLNLVMTIGAAIKSR